jgi:hypothetical protein
MSPAHDPECPTVSERQLAALAAGLVEEADEERLRRHLAGCDACRQRWNELREQDHREPDGTAHLAPAMIARWELARRSLRGIERTLVQHHLDHCATCRAELEALGHEPSLTRPASDFSAALEARRRSRSTRAGWFLVGATCTAAAAVLLMTLLPQGPPGIRPPEAVIAPWVAPSQLRGSTGSELVIAPGTARITLLVGVPPGFDTERPATLTVADPAGEMILRATVPPADLARGTLVVHLDLAPSPSAGSYGVSIVQTRPDAESVRENSHFLLGIREPSPR